jgi:hypothetical protein
MLGGMTRFIAVTLVAMLATLQFYAQERARIDVSKLGPEAGDG